VRAGRPRGVVRLTHLAEDLRLARDERVESGRDPEEVRDCLAVLPAREHAAELEPGTALELRFRGVRAPTGEVDLGAVARRQHHRVPEFGCELGRVAVPEVEALAHLERCVVVRHAHREQAIRDVRGDR
jgi:hypothetical protein